jgi:hypothetical protein
MKYLVRIKLQTEAHAANMGGKEGLKIKTEQ